MWTFRRVLTFIELPGGEEKQRENARLERPPEIQRIAGGLLGLQSKG